MLLRVYVILLGLIAVLRVGAQATDPLEDILDSIANPPLDKNPSLLFEQYEIQGERMSEDDPPKAYTFFFRNVGNKPLSITQVNTSCGCAVAEYAQAPIAPGKKGKIIVRYHPKDHPGAFKRRIYVYTDFSNVHPSARLTISGEVSPTKDKWRDYPVAMGSLYLKRNVMRFNGMAPNTQQIERIECINGGDLPLRLSAMAGMKPVWLTFRTEPEVIAPGEIADLVVEIDGKHLPSESMKQIEYSLLLDGINIRPSQRSLRVIIKTK